MPRLKGSMDSMTRSISGDEVKDLPSGKYPGGHTLERNLVVLEPLTAERHAAELYAVSHEDDEARRVWTYLPAGPFNDLTEFKAWVASCATASDHVFYALRDRASGRAGGMASYLDIQPKMGVIEIGYIWFAPFFQATRQATEALYLMLRHAFDDLRYRRMQWRCNALNEKSRQAALRLGFTYEGIFYQHMIVKGCNRDTAWYSIMDHEWPRIRTNFETWLSPDNFDEKGQQKQSLRVLNAGREA